MFPPGESYIVNHGTRISVDTPSVGNHTVAVWSDARSPNRERRLRWSIGLSNEAYVAALQEITKLRQLEAGSLTRTRMGRMALRAYLVEFGLTPASRGRVKVTGDTKPDDGFADFDDDTVN